jgi:hypothetical protein
MISHHFESRPARAESALGSRAVFRSMGRRGKLALVAFMLALSGCTPKIGDKCVLSTDCSTAGDRLCDTSQPGGYCTIFNCTGDHCPDKAACLMFEGAVPGCAYTDRGVPRTGRSFCVAQCSSNADCREGYICADPRTAPWNAIIIDDDQNQLTCLVDPLASFDPNVPPDGGAAVCQANGPTVPPIEAGAPSFDAGVGTTTDAGALPDGGDAGDAGDGGDGGGASETDAATDGPVDAGAD